MCNHTEVTIKDLLIERHTCIVLACTLQALSDPCYRSTCLSVSLPVSVGRQLWC